MPARQQLLSAMVVEHALDASLCALPAGVSFQNRHWPNREGSGCTCTLVVMCRSRGGTRDSAYTQAGSGAV
jgi:hypothetical protein